MSNSCTIVRQQINLEQIIQFMFRLFQEGHLYLGMQTIFSRNWCSGLANLSINLDVRNVKIFCVESSTFFLESFCRELAPKARFLLFFDRIRSLRSTFHLGLSFERGCVREKKKFYYFHRTRSSFVPL